MEFKKIAITVRDYNEYKQLFDYSKNSTLSDALLECVEANLDNDRMIIDDIIIKISEVGYVVKLNFKRNEFMQILEEQLKAYESSESYEACAQIVKIIQKLKSGSIVQSLVDTTTN